jgi:hypothetical protein
MQILFKQKFKKNKEHFIRLLIFKNKKSLFLL